MNDTPLSLTTFSPSLSPLPTLSATERKAATDVLLSPTPGEWRRRRGDGIEYIPWRFFAYRLTQAFSGAWYYTIDQAQRIEGPQGKSTELEVLVALTLHTPLGSYPACGSQKYFANNPQQTYANAFNGAKSKALRAAASNLMFFDAALDVDLETQEQELAEVREARDRLRKARSEFGLNEQQAIQHFSKALTGDGFTLKTLDDCLTATQKAGPAAFDHLIELLA